MRILSLVNWVWATALIGWQKSNKFMSLPWATKSKFEALIGLGTKMMFGLWLDALFLFIESMAFCWHRNKKGALRIPLVAQNSSVLLLPKVAASLKLHDSTARWCFCWFLAKNLQVHIIAKMIAKMNLQTWWNFLESARPNV